MVRSTDKYQTKAEAKKTVTKIDGNWVEVGSAEWEAYSCKWRYYQFLEDKYKNPNAKNVLDQVDWETYWPEVNDILKKWGMVNKSNEEYEKAAIDYQQHLENGGRVYKNKIHGYGYIDPETKEFVLDPNSVQG